MFAKVTIVIFANKRKVYFKRQTVNIMGEICNRKKLLLMADSIIVSIMKSLGVILVRRHSVRENTPRSKLFFAHL